MAVFIIRSYMWWAVATAWDWRSGVFTFDQGWAEFGNLNSLRWTWVDGTLLCLFFELSAALVVVILLLAFCILVFGLECGNSWGGVAAFHYVDFHHDVDMEAWHSSIQSWKGVLLAFLRYAAEWKWMLFLQLLFYVTWFAWDRLQILRDWPKVGM